MTILPRVAAAALALAMAAAPATASGEEATTIGFSSDLTGYINAIYRPPVMTPQIDDVDAVLQAECKFDTSGVGRMSGDEPQVESETVVLVGKVVTNDSDDAPLIDALPAATGVICEVYNGVTNALIARIEGARPGNAGWAADVKDVTNVQKPRICVQAYVLYQSGREFRGNQACKSS